MLDIPLPLFSHYDRLIIEFARNPHALAPNICYGLNRSTAVLLATAIYKLFGLEGAIYEKR